MAKRKRTIDTKGYKAFHKRVVKECVRLMGKEMRDYFNLGCDYLEEYIAKEKPADVAQDQYDAITSWRRFTALRASVQTSGLANHTFLGTLDLPIEVPKKEVEKVIVAEMTTNGVRQRILNDIIPPDAYDITVHYKIKE